jgi:hypothetical protein
MSKIKFLIFIILAAALAAQAPGAALAQVPFPGDPGGVPHYFGPYGNWAFSPLPRGAAVVTITNAGTGYVNPQVTIDDAYGTEVSCIFTLTPPIVVAPVSIPAGTCGTNFTAPIATITDPAGPGTGAIADAVIGAPFVAGSGMQKFIDSLPGLYDPRSGVPAPAKSIPCSRNQFMRQKWG